MATIKRSQQIHTAGLEHNRRAIVRTLAYNCCRVAADHLAENPFIHLPIMLTSDEKPVANISGLYEITVTATVPDYVGA